MVRNISRQLGQLRTYLGHLESIARHGRLASRDRRCSA
jgi:hypothetical protein